MQYPQESLTSFDRSRRDRVRQRSPRQDCRRRYVRQERKTQGVSARDAVKGMAILLLDAENLKFDASSEAFLATLSDYPLTIRVAFANWKSSSVAQQDNELYSRGYQLIHVPDNKNSADGAMLAMGAALRLHYPEAKSVFVCSSDRLLVHLCNELQHQGLEVYRVSRKDDSLKVEGWRDRVVRCYSLSSQREIPSLSELSTRLDRLLQSERSSFEGYLKEIAQLSSDLRQWHRLAPDSNGSSANLTGQPNPRQNEKNGSVISVPVPETENRALPSSIPSRPYAEVNLERELVILFRELQAQTQSSKVSLTILGTHFCKQKAKAISTELKKLGINGKFVDFVKSCPAFKLELTEKEYFIKLVES